MDRRRFLGLAAGALAGGVFVPKYERWFRPNGVWVPEPDVPITPVYYAGAAYNDFDAFTKAVLRDIQRGLGLSPWHVAGDRP